jgi:8-oxo-dGTP pyrophosphatase MutT (NUDIX family)
MQGFEDIRAALGARPINIVRDTAAKRAAVSLILHPGGHILMMRRQEREGDPWSGHMAFPGGRVESSDASLRAAAERETEEEVSIELPLVAEYLGRLSDLDHPRLVVSAFVYGLRKPVEPSGNHEVASLHWFALSSLRNPANRGSLDYEYQGQSMRFPSVRLDGMEIWGISLQFLDDLDSRLF